MTYFVLFDDASAGRAKLFERYAASERVGAQAPDGLDGALRRGWARGLHCAVFAAYSDGLPPGGGGVVLHWFEECRELDAAAWLAEQGGETAGISAPECSTSRQEYLDAVRQIRAAIARGDTYQINYTVRLHLTAYGNPAVLYRRLRQNVPYAALACLPDGAGAEAWTLCFSPELFLKIGSDGTATAEPMKGTAPFLGDGADEARAQALQADAKNRAENVMIVDLLRNDLGRIAETGGVSVPEPFKVRRFGSVWQMTSVVRARLKTSTRAADVFAAAFPCGSVTGAPKRMSMAIIGRLENEPRGLYCGSIGYLMPSENALGFEGVLNVVIRTLLLKARPDGTYAGVYGVGSGIVADSVAENEYEECGWKARFLTTLSPEAGIFETMRVDNGVCMLLEAHLGRLKTSARALNLHLTAGQEDEIRRFCQTAGAGVRRVKALLDAGGLHLSVGEAGIQAARVKVKVCPETLPPQDYLRRFKTTRRAFFDRAWQQAEAEGAFDSLIFGDDGFLLEGGRSNVFICVGGVWHTPSSDGRDLLCGIMRQEILKQPRRWLGAAKVYESSIDRNMLDSAERIVLCNALRGVLEARLA